MDTVSSLPSDRWLTVADNTRQTRRTGDKSAQWTRAFSLISVMNDSFDELVQLMPQRYAANTNFCPCPTRAMRLYDLTMFLWGLGRHGRIGSSIDSTIIGTVSMGSGIHSVRLSLVYCRSGLGVLLLRVLEG